MATPADNLERIADLSQGIHDFSYNTDVTATYIEAGIANLSGDFAQLSADISASLASLDQTLVMVGNNLATQIQMSGTGLSTANIENELKYHSAVLDNVSQHLDHIKKISMVSLRASNMNFNSLQDSDCCEMLIAAIQSFMKNNGNGKDGKGGGGGFSLDILSLVTKSFSEIVDFASKFVSALDPAIMQKLAMTFQDLMAVVGIGLRPIIQAVIPIIRAWADMLMPLMGMLEPVVKRFGDAMIQIAIPYLTLMANVVLNLIPVLEGIIPLFFDVADILMALTPVLNLLFDALSRGMSFVSGIFHAFMLGLKLLTMSILDVAAWITSWVSSKGAKSLNDMSGKVAESAARSAEAMGDSFKKWVGPSRKMPAFQPGASVGAAAKQSSYMGIADLGKNMMQAAFGQSVQNATIETANNTKQINDGIKQLIGINIAQGAGNRRQQGVRN